MSEQNNSANNFNAAKSDQFSDTGLTANAQLSKARQASAESDRPNFLKLMDESDQRVKEIQARNEPSPPPTGPSRPTAEMVNLLLSSPEAYRAQLIGDLLTAVGPYTQRSIFRDFQSSQSQYHSETPNWQTPDPKILPRKEYSHQKASVFNPSGPPDNGGDDGDDSSDGGGDNNPHPVSSIPSSVQKPASIPPTKRLTVPKTVKEAIQSSIIPFQLNMGKSTAGYALDFLESVSDAATKLECSETAALIS